MPSRRSSLNLLLDSLESKSIESRLGIDMVEREKELDFS